MLNKCCEIAKCCVDVIVCILLSLLLFIAGLIVGAYTSLATVLGLGAIIATRLFSKPKSSNLVPNPLISD